MTPGIHASTMLRPALLIACEVWALPTPKTEAGCLRGYSLENGPGASL